MKNEVTEINKFLSIIIQMVELENKNSYTDYNRYLEDIVLDILSVIGFDANIRNMNYLQTNFPGIDLIGESYNYQVTSTTGIKRVRDSYSSSSKNEDVDMSRVLYMVYLKSEVSNDLKNRVRNEFGEKVKLLSFSDIVKFASDQRKTDELYKCLKKKFDGQYKTIAEIENELKKRKKSTLKIDLDFFDYNNEKFDEKILSYLLDDGKREFFISSFDSEEARYVVCSSLKRNILKSENKLSFNDVVFCDNKSSSIIDEVELSEKTIVCTNNFETSNKKIVIYSSEDFVYGGEKYDIPTEYIYNRVNKLENAGMLRNESYDLCKNSYNNFSIIKKVIFDEVYEKSEFIKNKSFLEDNYMIFKMCLINKFSLNIDLFQDVTAVEEFVGNNLNMLKLKLKSEFSSYFQEYDKLKLFVCKNQVSLLNQMLNDIAENTIRETFDFYEQIMLNEKYFDYNIDGTRNYLQAKGGVLSFELYDSVTSTIAKLIFRTATKHDELINTLTRSLVSKILLHNNYVVTTMLINNIHDIIEFDYNNIFSTVIKRMSDSDFLEFMIFKGEGYFFKSKLEILLQSSEVILYTNFYYDYIKFLIDTSIEYNLNETRQVLVKFFNPRILSYNVHPEEKYKILESIKDDDLKINICCEVIAHSKSLHQVIKPLFLAEREECVFTYEELFESLRRMYVLYMNLDKSGNILPLLATKFECFDLKLQNELIEYINNSQMNDEVILNNKRFIREKIVDLERYSGTQEVESDKIEFLYEIYDMYSYSEDNKCYETIELFTFTDFSNFLIKRDYERYNLSKEEKSYVVCDEFKKSLIRTISKKECLKLVAKMSQLESLGAYINILGWNLSYNKEVDLNSLLTEVESIENDSFNLFVNDYIRNNTIQRKVTNVDIYKVLKEHKISDDKLTKYFNRVYIDNTFMNIDETAIKTIISVMLVDIDKNYLKKDECFDIVAYCVENNMVGDAIKVLSDSFRDLSESDYDFVLNLLITVDVTLLDEHDARKIGNFWFKQMLEDISEYYFNTGVDNRVEECGILVYKFYPFVKNDVENNVYLKNCLNIYLFNNPLSLYNLYNDLNERGEKLSVYYDLISSLFDNGINIFDGKSVEEIDKFITNVNDTFEDESFTNIVVNKYLGKILCEFINAEKVDELKTYAWLYESLEEESIASMSSQLYNSIGVVSESLATPNKTLQNNIEKYVSIRNELDNSCKNIILIIDDTVVRLSSHLVRSEERHKVELG